jgi:hypothetical protein
MSGVIGLLFWWFRKDMQTVRRAIAGSLIALHLIMKAPVWFIFMKMSSILGGDGYTRSYVIDQAIRHFSEWWLVGTSNTIRWFDSEAIGELDLTNQFVGSAMVGGVFTLIFFILIFVRCWRHLGLAMSALGERASETVKFLWCLGAALFAHFMAQFTVGYFDQMHVPWWGLIATISSVTTNVMANASETAICEISDDEVLARGNEC